jgi:hypothetical protein
MAFGDGESYNPAYDLRRRRLEPEPCASVQKEAMKVRSSVNRRSFGIEPAGYFNVLRPSTRFIASHLQRRFPYLVRQSSATDRDHADSQETAKPLQLMTPSTRDYRKLRPALIVLAAIAITLVGLWWIDASLFTHNLGW